MPPEAPNNVIRYAPLWVHLSVYVLTCLIAAVPFYLGYGPFLVLVDYFSGTAVPKSFSPEQTAALLALFLGAPALFTLGYLMAMRIKISPLAAVFRAMAGSRDHAVPDWFPGLVFCVAASIGLYDLAQTGAFSRLGAWVDYGQWIQARWGLFSTLGYFNFVNLYLIVPLSAAWAILTVQGAGLWRQAARWIPVAIVVALTFFLFQKKALITALIIIFGAMLLHRALSEGWGRRLTWLFAAGTGLLAVVYFLLVVLPVYSETSKTADEVLKPAAQQQEATQQQEQNRSRGAAVVSLLGPDREAHVLVYALLAPMTRTSAPAMYYPIVFPEHHGYFGLDLGQDILGWGSMPDDNRVVWKYMYPDMPGGSVAAPFQFVLYSQVGTGWSLMLSALLGALCGVLWQGIVTGDGDRAWRSLMGAVLLLFSIYLAIDSLRGSLVASYGVIWGWLFISLSFFIGRLLKRRQEFEPARLTALTETTREADSSKPQDGFGRVGGYPLP